MTVLATDRAIYSALTNNPPISALLGNRIYYGVAPLDTDYPLAVISMVDSNEITGLGACRLMSVEIWQVTLWTDKRSFEPIETLADMVIGALHNQPVGSSRGVYQTQQREQEQDNDRVYHGIVLEFKFFKE